MIDKVARYIDGKADAARRHAKRAVSPADRDTLDHVARAFDNLADEIRIGLHDPVEP